VRVLSGKQLRDTIRSADLVTASHASHRAPRPATVDNIGEGRTSNCSMLEATELCEMITRRKLQGELSDTNRIGDHH
jgi:CDP-paratose 2-epimerase